MNSPSLLPVLLLALLAGCAGQPIEAGAEPPDTEPWPLVLALDFEDESSMEALSFTDPEAWDWSSEGGVPCLELIGGSAYNPSHRSPFSIAVVNTPLVGDFALELDLLQTGREYGHRDMCVFFGFESPTRFYYTHLASSPDEVSHNILVVDDAPRVAVAPVAAEGIDWGEEEWHRIRVERSLADSTIRVFFDDLTTPVLQTTSDAIGWGRVGFGSFDDSGRVTRVRLWAPSARDGQPIDFPDSASAPPVSPEGEPRPATVPAATRE